MKSPAEMNGDELFAAWRIGGPSVVLKAFPNSQRFENFRKDFRDNTLRVWSKNVAEPARAMFMLDIAIATQPRHRYWADYLRLGHEYLASRRERVGAWPEVDEFELLWNKTAISFASGRRQPEVVEELIKWMSRRISPVPPPPPSRPNAMVPPWLVDPWIVLMQGYAQEAYVMQTPSTLEKRGRSAIQAFDRALTFESTRAEAAVRKAWLLLQSNRPSDALATLDQFQETWTNEAVLLYWARLLRAKALAGLGQADASVKAYGTALELMPSAQSPRVGIMSIEFNRGRADVAEAIAKDVRTAVDPVHDPWWIYPHGDLRFFVQREKALRAMAGK